MDRPYLSHYATVEEFREAFRAWRVLQNIVEELTK